MGAEIFVMIGTSIDSNRMSAVGMSINAPIDHGT